MARAKGKSSRAKEPLPPPLPPETRTVGQLVAETIRFYRHHFWQSLPLGLSVALLTQASIELRGAGRPSPFERAVDDALRRGHDILIERADDAGPSFSGAEGGVLFTAAVGGALLTLAYVFACALVSGKRLDMRSGLTAVFAGFVAFFPTPFLVTFFVLPGVAWLALVGMVVPVAVIERTNILDSFSKAFRLSRADYVHALGGLATLVITFVLTRLVLVFLLQGAGESTARIAVFLADLVLSPILFLGSALLYFDQSARLSSGRSRRERRRDAYLPDAVHPDRPGAADAPVEPGPTTRGEPRR